MLFHQQIENGGRQYVLRKIVRAGEDAAGIAVHLFEPRQVRSLRRARGVRRHVFRVAFGAVGRFRDEQQFAVVKREPSLPLRVGNAGTISQRLGLGVGELAFGMGPPCQAGELVDGMGVSCGCGCGNARGAGERDGAARGGGRGLPRGAGGKNGERGPLDWAMTQNNLGNALRTLGERESGTARLEEAVAAFDACLAVTTPVWPPEWVRFVESRRDETQAEIARRSAK